MVKSLYTDPIDWDGRNCCEFRVQWFFCVSMYSNAMVILSFIEAMSPSSTNVDSLRNDMSSFVV